MKTGARYDTIRRRLVNFICVHFASLVPSIADSSRLVSTRLIARLIFRGRQHPDTLPADCTRASPQRVIHE